MEESLLDTDILSEVLKAKDPRVLDRATQYLAQHARFTFSAFTFYEIVRGFRANQAVRQLANFMKLAQDCDVVPISTPVLERAARLWAEAYVGGHPRDDADLIIAATALETHRVLVTGNTGHFSWIPHLQIEDWRNV